MNNHTPTVLAVYARVPQRNAASSDRAAIFERRRIDTAAETALFVPEQGLVGSSFYHNNLKEHGEPVGMSKEKNSSENKDDAPAYPLDNPKRVYEERAILMQSLEHYEEMASPSSPITAPYFASLTETNTNKIDAQRVLSDPRFGEQIIVQGLRAESIMVGDVFVFCHPDDDDDDDDDKNTGTTAKATGNLVVQVTSPRLACSRVDQKNGSPYGNRGVRRHVNTCGMGGWFVRVLQAGSIKDGMKIVIRRRGEQSNAGVGGWTVAEVARALYGECDTRHHNLNKPQWNRSKAELEDLCSLESLGWIEWRGEAQKFLDRWESSQRPVDSCGGNGLAGKIRGWFVWVTSCVSKTDPPLLLAVLLIVLLLLYPYIS